MSYKAFKRLCNGKEVLELRNLSRECKQTFVDVNNNDFATVYLREACAKLSLPKREEREEHTQTMQRRKNTAAICERVSANAAVSPHCLCVPSFVSLAVGRIRFCFVWFSSQIWFVKGSVPGSAERSDAACIKTGTRNIVILLF